MRAREYRRWRQRIGAVVIHAILIAGAVFMLLPMIWMLATSFKPGSEIIVWPPRLLPQMPTLDNYRGLFAAAPFLRFFGNSVFLSVASTISVVITSCSRSTVFPAAGSCSCWCWQPRSCRSRHT